MVEIEDDGRGLDLDALAARASASGLPTATTEQIIEAVWIDGVSTAGSVSELSGRGVGMSALRAAVRATGGEVDVESGQGLGTTIRLTVPHRVGPAQRSRGAGPASLKPPGRGAVRNQARLTPTLVGGDVR